MKISLRLIARLAFLLVVLTLLGIGAVLAWFTSWRSDRQAALDAASEIVETTSGRVEFATRGEGPAVLVFHGAPGGYDQALLLGSNLASSGFEIIAPSRPGYLRTPLQTGIMPMQQADAMAALLDKLGVESVAVLADSAGGPAAVEFAVRYPQRTWALVLVSAVTQRVKPEGDLEPTALVLNKVSGDIDSWMLLEKANRDPRGEPREALAFTSTAGTSQLQADIDFILGNVAQLAWFRDLVGTFAPLSPRETGTRNDRLQFRTLQEYPFSKITAPTLVVHGTLDRLVSFKDAEKVAGLVPRGTLYPVQGAGHLVQLGPHGEDVPTRIAAFLRDQSGGHSQP